MNQAALDLVGLAREELVGKPAIELTATPEDMFFWEDVAAGLTESIFSETLVRGADGVPIPVERRVSRVWPDGGAPVFLVGMRDLRHQRNTENMLESLLAELRATLESTADGILAIDLEGRVRNYNRRFAELWQVPDHLMLERDDAALFAHLASMVEDGAQYQARLDQLAQLPLLEATDALKLRSGRTIERVSRPQYSRGQPSGRVFAFGDISQRIDSEARLRLAAKVFESSLDAVFISGPDYLLLAANPACERLTGSSQAQLLAARHARCSTTRTISASLCAWSSICAPTGSGRGRSGARAKAAVRERCSCPGFCCVARRAMRRTAYVFSRT